MGTKKRIAIPLILILAASSIAIPFAFDMVDDDGPGETGTGTSDGDQSRPDASSGSPSGSAEQVGQPSGASDTRSPLVGNLLATADPTSQAAGEIRSRLAPLTATANGSVEPFEVPEPTTLYQATLAHPAHSNSDLVYVESLQPLPSDLDQALAYIVLAHGVSTTMMSQSGTVPGASLRASVTMATALDTAMPTLERYVDHPVWDEASNPSTSSASSSSTTVEAPPLGEALVDLYDSMGYGDDTLDAIRPQAESAAADLAPERARALAQLVTAQANVQRAAAEALLFFATPASHDGPVDATADQVDAAVDGSPVEDLQAATQALRDTADAVDEAVHGAGDVGPVRDEPWVGPLGLVVVGTGGSDTFDGRHGGAPVIRDTLSGAGDQARSTVGTVETNTSEAGAPDAVEDAGPDGSAAERVTTDNGSTVPQAGFHMLVVDPGGDDTYHSNAGGIDAGSVIVEADVNAVGAFEGVKKTLIRDDEVCVPTSGLCEPEQTDLAGILRQIVAPGVRASQGPVSTGIPLTAAVVETGGDDTYQDAGPVIQGAARGFGVGLLLDLEGDDTYQASEIAQGASERYGIGQLIDRQGDDSYNATARAQGWADVPHPNATVMVEPPFFEDSTAVPAGLARLADGSLVDASGTDEYAIEDDLAGQGMAEISDGFVRTLIANGYPVETLGATLLDVGGDDQLPIPDVKIRGEQNEMRPSRSNVSGEEVAHFWLSRPVPREGENFQQQFRFFIFFPVPSPQADGATERRFKTAVHAAPGAIPSPVEDDAVRLGSINNTCREGRDGGSRSTAEFYGCGAMNFVLNTPDLLLFGEPNRVEDPPALTVTFGGDTHYNGTIASPEPDVDAFRGIGGLTFPVPVPRILVDLAGDDNYTGGNETIGYVEGTGASLVVDRQGADRMVAGNRSIASVTAPVEGGTQPVAAVLDLDGRLQVSSHNRSQAYASKISSQPPTVGGIVSTAGGGRAQISLTTGGLLPGTTPPLALLHAGDTRDGDSVSADDPATPGPGLDLDARNQSQGYSVGLGVGIVVGSTGDDTYTADGWAQGFHDGQQILQRFCTPFTGGAQEDVDENLRTLTPWLGGIGAVIDPDGQDTYRVDGDVGMGDAFTDLEGCAENRIDDEHTETQHVSLLGLGTLLDVRGKDSYAFTELPPRPEALHERSCSGANHTECEPTDDRAWMVIDEEQIQREGSVGTVQLPAAVGLGVDNVRNTHHAAMAACRNYDPIVETERLHHAAQDEADTNSSEIYEEQVPDSAGPNPAPNDTNVPIEGSNATLLQCDETLRTLWDVYLKELVIDSVGAIDRGPNLELSLPREGASTVGSASQSADVGDETRLNQLPIPEDARPGDDPDTLFLDEVGEPQCRDRQDSQEVRPTGGPDVGCLSVTRDINLGQWVTSSPNGERLDPGDTIGCNCSVRLQIEPDTNTTVFLPSLAERNLYPQSGAVTTFTQHTETWYDAFSRFRVPLTLDDPIRDGQLRGDFLRPEAAADFPINLSEMPTGLANVEVTAIVEDTASEETGGAVPAATRTFEGRKLIQERDFDEAFLGEDASDGESYVFFSAPGPVHEDDTLQLTIQDPTSEQIDTLEDNDWEPASGDNFTHELPSGAPVDGPAVSSVVPVRGASACAALIVEQRNGEGSCWTGESLVVGLPLEEIDPAEVDAVHAAGNELSTTTLDLTEPGEDPEPTIQLSRDRPDDDDTYDIRGLGDVFGVPGTSVLPNGSQLAETLLDEEVEGKWARLVVEPDRPGAVGLSPKNPSNLAEICADNWPCHFGSGADRNEGLFHEHGDIHEVIGEGIEEHPHVLVWSSNDDDRPDAPVARGGELTQPTRVNAQGCVDLNYAQLDDVRDLFDVEAHLTSKGSPDASGPRNEDMPCAVFADGEKLVYLVPLGDSRKTHVVSTSVEMLRKDASVETFNVAGHVDPVAPAGQVATDPAASQDLETEVLLRLFPQTAERPHLTDLPDEQRAGSDIVDARLEARHGDGNWTSLGNVWADGEGNDIPTPRDPTEKAHVNLSSVIEGDIENITTTAIDLRAVLVDESNNTLPTSSREFLVDRVAPNVTNARVVQSSGQDRLILDVDEPLADVSCAQEGCPLVSQQTVPGAQPQAFLALDALRSGTLEVSIPIIGLKSGPSYTVTLELVDKRGIAATTNVTVDTFNPLELDAATPEGTLVNKTITLNWTADTRGGQTLSTFTSAYLMLPSGPCPVMKGEPGVVTPGQELTQEVGPLSVRGEAGEDLCEIPEVGVNATLLLYSLVPNQNLISVDEVPVHVDTTAPTVNLTAPDEWVNETVIASANASDALPTEVELVVDGKVQATGDSPTASISDEGVHDVLARADDAAGNTGLNRTEVRIDRTPPDVAAQVVGVRGGLALVNVTATDALSGVGDVQLRTGSTTGPKVPGIGNRSLLLSIPVEPGDDQLVLQAHDEAANPRDVRLSLTDVPRVESGPLVQDLVLSTPAPDTLHLEFGTTNETTPVVIVDAGDRHVEEALDTGHDHELTVDELPPGRRASVTIAVPQGGDLVPATNATTTLPDDRQPPSALPNVEAEPVEGGVRFSWGDATDNVGVRNVVIYRDGSLVTRTSAGTYVDEPRTFEEHSYKLAAVDMAGNRGPWTRLSATPVAEFEISELISEPATLTPEEPVTMQAKVQTPAGLEPDVVTLTVDGHEMPMQRVDAGPYTSLYELRTRLPALNVTTGQTDLVVTASAGDQVETAEFPAPVVSEAGEAGRTGAPSEVPGVGLLATLSLLAGVSILRRRWSM